MPVPHSSVRGIRVDRLDPMVWADVCRLLSSPALVTEALRRASAGELVQDDRDARLQHLQQARRRAERQSERLVDAFTAEVITLDELKVRRAALHDRIQTLMYQERELHTQQQHRVRLTELCANIEVLCAGLRAGLESLDFARRRRIVELLVDRVPISHEEIEIRYAIPLEGLGQKGTLRLPYRGVSLMVKPLSQNLGAFREEAGHAPSVASVGLCLHRAQASRSF
jgi:site-specific DNA recombinase